MVSSIGRFAFLQMSGPPQAIAAQLDVESRAGVDGNALWNTGQRGRPFEVETLVDLANLAVANAAYRSYQSLIGSGPHQVIWGGVFTSLQVEVLDVTPAGTPSLAVTAIGGLTGGACTLRCRWTLIAIG